MSGALTLRTIAVEIVQILQVYIRLNLGCEKKWLLKSQAKIITLSINHCTKGDEMVTLSHWSFSNEEDKYHGHKPGAPQIIQFFSCSEMAKMKTTHLRKPQFITFNRCGKLPPAFKALFLVLSSWFAFQKCCRPLFLHLRNIPLNNYMLISAFLEFKNCLSIC